jgi:catechol 2,3-dioxygenase-like lactoylglutathione lyase family enzyme
MNAKLDAIGLVVQDMAQSVAFYRELGFDFPEAAEHQPHVEAAAPGGLRLLWDTVETIKSFDPSWRPASGGHRIALAFRLDSPAGVDDTFNRLVRLGHVGHKAPWDAVWGQRYAIVHDPDGNAVDLFSSLATSS